MREQLLGWFAVVLVLAACGACVPPDGTGSDAQALTPIAATRARDEAAGGAIQQVVSPTPALDSVQVDTSQLPDLQAKPEKNAACPGLDSSLYQIAQSPEPIAAARRIGLRVKENRVQSTLTLAGTDPTFLSAHGVQLGTQSGHRVQAYVPIERLCEIAGLEGVVRLGPAAIGTAQ